MKVQAMPAVAVRIAVHGAVRIAALGAAVRPPVAALEEASESTENSPKFMVRENRVNIEVTSRVYREYIESSTML